MSQGAVTSSRTKSAQLQRMLGTHATLTGYVHQTDHEHASPGWWCAVHHVEPDCGCAWCQSAEEEREHYIAFHFRQAILEIDRYLQAHDDS